MKFKDAQAIQTIAALLNCKVMGNTAQLVTGINEIHMVESGDVVFVDHPKYYDKALKSKQKIKSASAFTIKS